MGPGKAGVSSFPLLDAWRARSLGSGTGEFLRRSQNSRALIEFEEARPTAAAAAALAPNPWRRGVSLRVTDGQRRLLRDPTEELVRSQSSPDAPIQLALPNIGFYCSPSLLSRGPF